MSQLMSVRHNQNFTVDHETGKLVAQTEIIILVEKPVYTINKKGTEITKASELTEIRFTTSASALNQLIGSLNMAQQTVSNYEQMAGSLNEIIIAAKKPNLSPDINPKPAD